ncbi:hypothetical protein HMI55_004120, partial [Coelomomyces lativittatus]
MDLNEEGALILKLFEKQSMSVRENKELTAQYSVLNKRLEEKKKGSITWPNPDTTQSEMKSKVEDLQINMEDFKRRIIGLVSEIAELKTEYLSVIEAQLEEFQNYDRTIIYLHAQKMLRNEISELKRKLTANQTSELRKVEKQLEQAQQEIFQLKKEGENLKCQEVLNETPRRLGQKKAKHNELKDTLKHCQGDISKLKEEIKNKEQEKQKYKQAKAKELEAAKKEFQKNIREKEKALT